MAVRAGTGQVMVLICLAIVTFMGLIGIVADVGSLEAQKQWLQTAADSAAMAAGQELGYGDAVAAGRADAATNGYTNGTNGVAVTINNPPLSGPNTGNSNYVEAIVSKPIATFFLSALGLSSITIQGRAVTGISSGPNCIYILNPSAANVFYLNGGVNVQSSCGVIVDSTSSNALYAAGSIVLTASSIGVVGGVYTSGSVTFTPAVKTGVMPATDPLAYVPAPTVGACNHTYFGINGLSGTHYTVSPGVYCGGINITGVTNVTFNAGTYILAGGGLTINGTTTMTGAGVTFYDTTGTGGYVGINFYGSYTVTLSAPTTGALAGMLFFQDRTIAVGSGQSGVAGSTTSTFDGAFYFPTTILNYAGKNATNGYSVIVAYEWIVNGSASTVGNNYSTLPGGSPVQGVSLAE
jgi:hypothetical protein